MRNARAFLFLNFYTGIKKYIEAETIYILWQFLSEATLIKAMNVLMLNLEVSSVPLIVYWD